MGRGDNHQNDPCAMRRVDEDSDRPAPLKTDGSNAFARHSMAVRIPGIIDEVIERNAGYSAAVVDRLTRLRDEIAGNESIRLFEAPAPDYDVWAARFGAFEGETWLGTEWFFAEMLSYRLIMEAVGYWATLRDPFAPFKEEELASDALWKLLEEVQQVDGPLRERAARILKYTLWGNRIDLSLSDVAAKGTEARDEHLLVDDSLAAVDVLLRREPGTVHVIMDNAGTEQAVDFVLADLLLEEGLARRIVLHVKMHPVLVSDVVVADVHRMLDALSDRGGGAAALAHRFREKADDRRLRIVPDFFWNTDGRWWELPLGIYDSFANASLVVAKGDVNYRRVTNDALWPADATLTDAAANFPGALLVLRTLKSDTLVGVAADLRSRLDAGEPDWRTNGTYGVIQLKSI